MAHDLTDYKRILLFGGSFDPPHRAHVELPQQAGRAIAADLIAYVPAGRAPHKLDQQQTDPRHRLAMLRLALQDRPGPIPTAVLTDEIDRGPDQPSYTVDTLSAIRERLGPEVELRLLIGADQLRIFDQWRQPGRIVALAEPVVMVRPPDTRVTLLKALPADQRGAWRDRLIDIDVLDINSTEIRERLSVGRSVDGLIAPSVAAYAAQHGLYR
ncbi:MAG: nicotinate (nicotinamide) nucleotide adenylyltransferase [Phycisphaeraceae bacterium]